MPTVHPVKIELAKRGTTQRQFARQVGVSAATLGAVLNGRVSSWPALRRRCSDALGIPEAELFLAQARPFDTLADGLGIDTSASNDTGTTAALA